MDYDLIVIGGGPAGYVGAIRAAQLGKKVVCVEMERAGGTCLNWGCIPTKALLKSAEMKQLLGHIGDYGLSINGEVGVDFPKVMQRSRNVSDQMAKGIEYLFKSKKVDYVTGKAQIQSPADSAIKKVNVTGADGKTQTLTGKAVLICTGAKAKALPGVKVDGDKVITSREALVVKKRPSHLSFSVRAPSGASSPISSTRSAPRSPSSKCCRKSSRSRTPRSPTLKRNFTKQGIEIYTDTKVEKTEVTDKGVKLTVAGGKTFEADQLLVAIGVEAQTDGLFGNGVKLELDRGYVKTNDRYETSSRASTARATSSGRPGSRTSPRMRPSRPSKACSSPAKSRTKSPSSPAAPTASRRSPASA